MLLLLLAALADLKTDRIPNGFVLLGMVTGILGSLRQGAAPYRIAVSVAAAFLLLYPLFKIGAMGAGDVKVLMMTGSFVGIKELLMITLLSFVIGAAASLGKLLSEHNGKERARYFVSYLSEVARTGQWKLYGEHTREDYERYCRNKIHFTVPILFGAALRIGGIF